MSLENPTQTSLQIGSIVELDILPPGCTTDNLSPEDLTHVVHMEKTRIESLQDNQGRLEGIFVLVPEEIPFTASLDQVVTRPASE